MAPEPSPTEPRATRGAGTSARSGELWRGTWPGWPSRATRCGRSTPEGAAAGARRGRAAPAPRRANLLALLGVAGLALGCSADQLDPPEPEVRAPGAFVAVEGWVEPGRLTLLRTLAELDLEGQRVLFLTVYEPMPRTWAEARTLARGPEPAIARTLDTAAEYVVLEREHQVVWFRTLTPAEEARVP